MENWQAILLGVGSFISIYIINNIRLKDGITDWFLNLIGRFKFDIEDHSVKETIKALKFESKLNDFDNRLKTDLYHFYIETVLTIMDDLVVEIINKNKNMSYINTKVLVKTTMYDQLSKINILLDEKILMPIAIQERFDKFRNYLTKQHTYAIEHALQSPNKKIMLLQVLDAIENNSRWFLFYTTEMFDTFNGRFNDMNYTDVFITKK